MNLKAIGGLAALMMWMLFSQSSRAAEPPDFNVREWMLKLIQHTQQDFRRLQHWGSPDEQGSKARGADPTSNYQFFVDIGKAMADLSVLDNMMENFLNPITPPTLLPKRFNSHLYPSPFLDYFETYRGELVFRHLKPRAAEAERTQDLVTETLTRLADLKRAVQKIPDPTVESLADQTTAGKTPAAKRAAKRRSQRLKDLRQQRVRRGTMLISIIDKGEVEWLSVIFNPQNFIQSVPITVMKSPSAVKAYLDGLSAKDEAKVAIFVGRAQAVMEISKLALKFIDASLRPSITRAKLIRSLSRDFLPFYRIVSYSLGVKDYDDFHNRGHDCALKLSQIAQNLPWQIRP